MELTAPPDPSGDGKGKARVGEERRRQKGGCIVVGWREDIRRDRSSP